MPRGVDGGDRHGADGIQAEGDGFAHDWQDVAVRLQKTRGGVVNAEAERAEVSVRDGGQNGCQISRGTAFANKHRHSRADLFKRLGRRDALMVGGDSGRGVAAKGLSGSKREMAVNPFSEALRRRDFPDHGFLARQHARDIHHLAKSEKLGTAAQDSLRVFRRKIGAGCLKSRGRDA